MIASTVTLAVLGLAALAVPVGLQRVPHGQVHSLYRRGRLRRLLQPGLHWRVPGLDSVRHRIDLGGHLLRLHETLGTATVQGTVYWQVLDPALADAVIDQVEQTIRLGAVACLRGEPVPGGDRRTLGLHLKNALNARLRECGTMVTRVELEFT